MVNAQEWLESQEEYNTKEKKAQSQNIKRNETQSQILNEMKDPTEKKQKRTS